MKPKKEKNSFTLLRLFVAGESAISQNAISNLNAIAREYLTDPHKIEIVDTLNGQTDAIDAGVLVTPTLLIKKDSMPVKKIIGDLSDKPKVSIFIEFEKKAPRKKKKS